MVTPVVVKVFLFNYAVIVKKIVEKILVGVWKQGFTFCYTVTPGEV